MTNGQTFISVVFILCLISLSSGCANRAVAERHSSFNLDNIKKLQVKRLAQDNRGVNLLIENKLRQMGYAVKTENASSDDIDAVITYKDKWWWDITMYMIELTISVRDKDSNFPLATGNSLHTSLTRKSPEAMVDEVLTNIFNQSPNK